jgi:hypothetical protein
MTTPHQVLGVPPGATEDEIRAAYKRKIAAVHPDRGGSTEEAATINKAYHDLTVEPPEVDPDAMPRKVLVQTLNNTLARGLYLNHDQDLVVAMRAEMESAIVELMTRQDIHRQGMRDLEKVLKKLTYKGKTGNPLLIDVLGHRIDDIRRSIEGWKQGVKDLSRAIELLAEYEWDGPKDSIKPKSWVYLEYPPSFR